MPQTSSKRLALTLKPHVYRTIERLGKARNKSMASVVGEILEEQEPILREMASMFEDALKGKGIEVYERLHAFTGKTLQNLGGVMQEIGPKRRKGGKEKPKRSK